MELLEKNIFYNDMIILFHKKFISENYLFEICIKNNNRVDKLSTIKSWMQEEHNYIELNYNKKDIKLWNKIYKKINKFIEKEVQNA